MMERYRVIGSVENFDGTQNLNEWIQMVERAAEFARWASDQIFKAALFKLRGEAGEYAEQLRDEGKIQTWKELKDALKERFNTAGKEQWHQYLLNTATQGSSTVQEWAQTVRRLSILALGAEGVQIKREVEDWEEDVAGEEDDEDDGGDGGENGGGGGENARGRDEARGGGALGEEEIAQNEARRKLLDFMRKSNFIRGLKSSLRQMVWRKKCSTFDEAVQAAAEEETVESSHREETVLSVYKRDIPNVTNQGLVEQLVAALELRDENKKKKEEEGQRDDNGKEKRPKPRRTRTSRSHTEPESDQESTEQEREDYEYHTNRRQPQAAGYTRRGSPAGPRYQPREDQRYGEQLPLPRNNYAGQSFGRRQEWTRQGQRNERGQTYRRHDEGRDFDPRIVCYGCGERGHMRRHCDRNPYGQQGNGYRRL